MLTISRDTVSLTPLRLINTYDLTEVGRHSMKSEKPPKRRQKWVKRVAENAVSRDTAFSTTSLTQAIMLIAPTFIRDFATVVKQLPTRGDTAFASQLNINNYDKVQTEYRIPVTRSPLHQLTSLSIRYPILSQKAGNVLVTPLGLRASMGGGEHLHSGDATARFPIGDDIQ
ncbi:hypothetical protein EVAR_56328_1 [Eumeta japonica]|uniref:Uncharacterized protein n=1 Tax=Eumeta variegata TaxID=151549 RepID=A0A4C1YG85_EUMVA|nr:hypothetical protein EVAR_56328_1 [Eumeta japonica]